MNDGSTVLKKFYDIKHFTVRINKTRVINDIATAMKTFTTERRYSTGIRYRVLDRATNWRNIIGQQTV